MERCSVTAGSYRGAGRWRDRDLQTAEFGHAKIEAPAIGIRTSWTRRTEARTFAALVKSSATFEYAWPL